MDNTQFSNTFAIRTPEAEERENREKEIFEERMAESLPELVIETKDKDKDEGKEKS